MATMTLTMSMNGQINRKRENRECKESQKATKRQSNNNDKQPKKKRHEKRWMPRAGTDTTDAVQPAIIISSNSFHICMSVGCVCLWQPKKNKLKKQTGSRSCLWPGATRLDRAAHGERTGVNCSVWTWGRGSTDPTGILFNANYVYEPH